MIIKFKNNASSILVEELAIDATTMTVSPGSADLFPVISPTESYFIVTLLQPDGSAFEIVNVTSVVGDTFTIERAQEGTTAQVFPINSSVEHRLTAGGLEANLNNAEATFLSPGILRVATEQEVIAGTSINTAVCPATGHLLSLFPGCIVAYSGTIDANGNPFPPGYTAPITRWHVCDGTNGTPDLTNTFIVGKFSTESEGYVGSVYNTGVPVSPANVTVEPTTNHEGYHKSYALAYIMKVS